MEQVNDVTVKVLDSTTAQLAHKLAIPSDGTETKTPEI
jgi:hypothetical protein